MQKGKNDMANRIILEEKPYKKVYREGDVVIKEFIPSYPKHKVLNEAYIQSCVESCGISIPKVLSVTCRDGSWSLSMDYIEGKSLEQLMREHPENISTYLEKLVEIQLEVGNYRVPQLRNTISKMEEIVQSLDGIDSAIRYELLQRLHGMKRHTKLCHGDFVPSNVIIRDDGSYCILDWSHATSGNAGADAAHTYMVFCLKNEEYAEEYLNIFCEKTGMSIRYVQKWLPIVAAAQLSGKNESEKEFLTQWVNVLEYQ